VAGIPDEEGAGRKVKLAWISPRRTLYISTAARQEAFSMSGDELASRFREGNASVVRAEGVVTVALSEALARSADNDASIILLRPPANCASSSNLADGGYAQRPRRGLRQLLSDK
jgi:uncharacterized membrane protein